MTEPSPRWQRRKDARPAEILEAAMDVFVETGFAAAKLDEIARRAGIAKGTLYRYFETKEDVFRAVAHHAVFANLEMLEAAAAGLPGSVAEFVPPLLARVAAVMGDGRVPAIIRMVIAESRAFPDLARIWHDDVVARMLDLVGGLVAAAQARGEVREGDARLHVVSIVGPMLMAVLYREVFGGHATAALDLAALAEQHAQTVLRGLLVPPKQPEQDAGRAVAS